MNMKVVFIILLFLLISCSPVSFDVPSIEKAVYKEINRVRQEQGLKPLIYTERYISVARAHSQDMIDRNYLEHKNPEGEMPWDRVKKVNLSYGAKMSENIHQENRKSDSPEEIAKTTVDSWLNSKEGHRENMLDSKWSQTSIGVAVSKEPEVGRYKVIVSALFFLSEKEIADYNKNQKTLVNFKSQIASLDEEMESLQKEITENEQFRDHKASSPILYNYYSQQVNQLKSQFNQMNSNRTLLVQKYNKLSQ